MTSSKRYRQMIFRIARVPAATTIALATGLILSLTLMSTAQAQTFNVLFNFSGNGSNGAAFSPYNGLTMTPGGNLYGTTLKGGTYEKGTVYELRHMGSGWVLNLLYQFQGGTDGADPVSGVTIGPSGVLYGTTEIGGDQSCGVAGGCGTVYSLRPPAHASPSASAPWSEAVIYAFHGAPMAPDRNMAAWFTTLTATFTGQRNMAANFRIVGAPAAARFMNFPLREAVGLKVFCTASMPRMTDPSRSAG